MLELRLLKGMKKEMVFQAEGTAYAKALRWEGAWCLRNSEEFQVLGTASVKALKQDSP